MNSKLPVICLMGPTASGKSNLALAMSKRLGAAEIVSVDSALVYREMNIGTAKPTVEERAAIPHHLIDLCDPREHYSVGCFYRDVTRCIAEIHQRQRIPILVGGTMMYFYALQFGLAQLPTQNSNIRAEIDREAQEHGWHAIHEKLQRIDPEIAARIHINDAQRIQRAMEIYLLTQQKPSELQAQINETALTVNYHFINLILLPCERKILHQKIADRFLNMLQKGFLEEARLLYERGDLHADLPAIRTLGYRQAWNYFSGQYNYDQMCQRAIIATRQLAKRQMTWLRRWHNAHRFEMDHINLLECVMQKLEVTICDLKFRSSF